MKGLCMKCCLLPSIIISVITITFPLSYLGGAIADNQATIISTIRTKLQKLEDAYENERNAAVQQQLEKNNKALEPQQKQFEKNHHERERQIKQLTMELKNLISSLKDNNQKNTFNQSMQTLATKYKKTTVR
jgi:hypothetical protein